jgi:hypothetical protein
MSAVPLLTFPLLRGTDGNRDVVDGTVALDADVIPDRVHGVTPDPSGRLADVGGPEPSAGLPDLGLFGLE